MASMNWKRLRINDKMRRNGWEPAQAPRTTKRETPKQTCSKRAHKARDLLTCQRAVARHYTAEEIDAKRLPAGGWSRRQLAQWGVPWPPPKGWRLALLTGKNPKSRSARNERLSKRAAARASSCTATEMARTIAEARAYDGPCPF